MWVVSFERVINTNACILRHLGHGDCPLLFTACRVERISGSSPGWLGWDTEYPDNFRDFPHSIFTTVTRQWAGQPRNHGWIPGRCKRFISSPYSPHQLWGPPSFLLNRDRRYKGRSVQLMDPINPIECSSIPSRPHCVHRNILCVHPPNGEVLTANRPRSIPPSLPTPFKFTDVIIRLFSVKYRLQLVHGL